MLAVAAVAGTACGPISGSEAADDEANLQTTQQPDLLGVTDFQRCASEWGTDGDPDTCHLGQGGKYVAFGAKDSSGVAHFNFSYFPAGDVPCSNDSFPGQADPLPGAVKRCYFTNLGRVAVDGARFTPYSVTGATGTVQIAYGGDSGFFNFKDVSAFGTYTCDAATFDSVYRPTGAPVACYQVLVGYHRVATDGGSFTVSPNRPVPAAYGNAGIWTYKNVSGTVSCSVQTFGGFGGSGGTCYVLDLGNNYLVPESQSFSMPRGYDIYRVAYTSGNGNAIVRNLRSGMCNNATFTDPQYGVQKHCYGVALIR